MKCIKCDTEMVLLNKWLNYPEASEWLYGCPRCYATCDINEAYGESWEGLND